MGWVFFWRNSWRKGWLCVFPLPPYLLWSIRVDKDSLQRADKDPGLLIGHVINKGITLPRQITVAVSTTAQILWSLHL